MDGKSRVSYGWVRAIALALRRKSGYASNMGHDLHIDLSAAQLASPGRAAIPLTVSVVRPLEDADLALLATEQGIQASPLKRLSSRHHGLARSLASGVPVGEAALIHGYVESRVSILQGDPAFQELVSFYREKIDVAFGDLAARMAGLARDAMDVLQERLEENDSAFTNKELLAIMDSMNDRTGYGKQSMQTQVKVDLTSRLNDARKRALEARIAATRTEFGADLDMIDVTPDE